MPVLLRLEGMGKKSPSEHLTRSQRRCQQGDSEDPLNFETGMGEDEIKAYGKTIELE